MSYLIANSITFNYSRISAEDSTPVVSQLSIGPVSNSITFNYLRISAEESTPVIDRSSKQLYNIQLFEDLCSR